MAGLIDVLKEVITYSVCVNEGWTWSVVWTANAYDLPKIRDFFIVEDSREGLGVVFHSIESPLASPSNDLSSGGSTSSKHRCKVPDEVAFFFAYGVLVFWGRAVSGVKSKVLEALMEKEFEIQREVEKDFDKYEYEEGRDENYSSDESEEEKSPKKASIGAEADNEESPRFQEQAGGRSATSKKDLNRTHYQSEAHQKLPEGRRRKKRDVDQKREKLQHNFTFEDAIFLPSSSFRWKLAFIFIGNYLQMMFPMVIDQSHLESFAEVEGPSISSVIGCLIFSVFLVHCLCVQTRSIHWLVLRGV